MFWQSTLPLYFIFVSITSIVYAANIILFARKTDNLLHSVQSHFGCCFLIKIKFIILNNELKEKESEREKAYSSITPDPSYHLSFNSIYFVHYYFAMDLAIRRMFKLTFIFIF